MKTNYKDIITKLQPFTGKKIGVDFGKRSFDEWGDWRFEIEGVGILCERDSVRGRLYYVGEESTYLDSVVGFSINCEGNVFHAGNFDAWQRTLQSAIEAEEGKKRLDKLERRKQETGKSTLAAVIQTLKEIGGRLEGDKKIDENTTFKELGLTSLDAIEFAAAFNQIWVDNDFKECSFSEKACDKLYALFKTNSTTVGQLVAFVQSLFTNENTIKKIKTFCESWDDCPHFEVADFAQNDLDLEIFRYTGQQCFFCKHWQNHQHGEPADCSIGECTYEWKDPNGDKQLTFWEEK